MKSQRVGLGKGRGKGYTNLVRTDPVVHRNAGLDKRVEETQQFMSVHFGGYTDIKAEGGYVSGKSGKVLKDKTVSVIGFASAENFLKHRDELKEWMMNKVSEWGQETLGFEFEDDLYYIKGKK